MIHCKIIETIEKILILKTSSKYYLFTGPLISTHTFNK